MNSFLIIFAVCIAATTAALLHNQDLHCGDTSCTGRITFGYAGLDTTLTTHFRYNSTAPTIRSSVESENEQFGSRLLRNETVTTQCVDLIKRGDKLCVLFDTTYNTTNARVKLHYRANTQIYGQETSVTQVVKFNPDGSSWYTLN